MPLPQHFRPERVGEVWRVDYEERASEAEAWAREHGIRPAAEDRFRICLVAVDIQNTFCTPGFELFVPGAVEDSRRLCEFVYRNIAVLTAIVPTLDTHQAIQIFHAAFLLDADGKGPPPYTLISAEDVESGRWTIDPDLGVDPEHLLRYTRALDAGGRYRLTVWPYHAMLGGIGHALVSAVEEAFFVHAITRRARPEFEIKGFDPLTEHYSVLGPEVFGEKNEAADPPAPGVRRGRVRGPGEEPLRRVDDRRPAAPPGRRGAGARAPHVPARGLHVAGRRAGRRRLHGGGGRRRAALPRRRDARRPLDRPDRELARESPPEPRRASRRR